MKEKSVIYLCITIVIFILFSIAVKIFINTWCKLRKKYTSFDYSYEIDDIKNRLKFSIKMICIFCIPIILFLLIIIYLIISASDIIAKVIIKDMKNLDIICLVILIISLITDIIFYIINFKKVIKIYNIRFDKYDEICMEFNVNNEKRIILFLFSFISIILIIFVHIFLFGTFVL